MSLKNSKVVFPKYIKNKWNNPRPLIKTPPIAKKKVIPYPNILAFFLLAKKAGHTIILITYTRYKKYLKIIMITCNYSILYILLPMGNDDRNDMYRYYIIYNNVINYYDRINILNKN